MKKFLCEQNSETLASFCKENSIPAFRAKQIMSWIFEHRELDPEKMLNLPKSLRELIAGEFYAPSSKTAELSSSGDGVEKLAIDLYDGECIEMVVIPQDERISFCLSTQVGCPVQCVFCASGKHGLVRNLHAGEMLEQFILGCRRIQRLPDNIVFMGIGEGLLNFNALALTLERLTGEEFFNMSPRRITVSTSGYVPGMLKFAELKREFNLAVSLHAVDDETRAKLIPPAVRYPIADILRAADICRDANNRQYTLEYTMIDNINCELSMARKLGEIALKHHAKINLIPFNETGSSCRRPSKEVIEEFEDAVKSTGARVTRRVERGSKKTAACGQLRNYRMQKSSGETPCAAEKEL